MYVNVANFSNPVRQRCK